jgi:hypothetical protein
MKSIDLVWTNPILIDEFATILAGHCRLEAAKRLGMADVPTITIAGLSDSEKRAIVIADKDSARNEARGPTGGTADQVRVGCQSDHGDGARPHGAADAARARRRGHRMSNRRELSYR